MKIQKGFTLLELLVVISIIGVLASVILVSFTGSQRQARDTAAKSDLKQYHNALTQHASKNMGIYPISETVTALAGLCTTLDTETCPEGYSYRTNDTGSRYVIWSELENNSDNIWVVCSSGYAGYYYGTTLGSADCPTLSEDPVRATAVTPTP